MAPALSLALVLLTGVAAMPAELPDETAIRAKIHAAMGPLSKTYRETYEFVASNGTNMTEHGFVRNDDYRYTYDAGPFHNEDGMFHDEAWHMNDNGQVVMDEPDPGNAVPDKTTTTVAAIHTPVEGFTIATLNVRSYGIKEYVDGIIGTEFLRLFTIGFDYGNSRLYLVPNGWGRRALGIK